MTKPQKDLDTTAESHKKPPGRKRKTGRMAPPTRGETLVKGVFMGFIISGVTHAGRSITKALLSHPLALFSSGVATGYFAHKYRKEIIVLGQCTAAESKNFLLRQRENILDLVAESQEHTQDKQK